MLGESLGTLERCFEDTLGFERDLVEVRLHCSGVEHVSDDAIGGKLQVVRKRDR